MSGPQSTAWWRHAVTYQVYVRSFADSDGDGVGDLPGITSRLPYLRDLGVDALWITPFYTSPQHDHGYDVADYEDVDPLFGTLADADALVATAHQLGLRVVSTWCPTTPRASTCGSRPRSPASPARRSGRATCSATARVPTATSRPTTGARSSAARPGPGCPDGQWYLHLFDDSQPDLDWRNPEVGDLFEAVLRFWLDRGVDGFRVDVAHGLVKEASLRDQVVAEGVEPSSGVGSEGEDAMGERARRDEPMWDQPELHDVYRRWHRVLAEYPGDRMTVAEAWTQSAESMARFVRSDEMSQAFNFSWLLAPWSARAFAGVIRSTLEQLSEVALRRRGC